MLVSIIKGISKLNEKAGQYSSWLILPLILTLTVEVIARYIFSRPTSWSYDMAWMTCAAFYILAGGYTLFVNGHVRIDLIYGRLPPRARGVIDTLGYLLFFFPFMAILVVIGSKFAYNSWIIGEKSPYASWKPLVGPIKTVLVIGILLLLLQGLVDFISHVRAALQKGGRHDS